MKLISLLLLGIVGCSILNGQQATGLVLSPEHYQSLPIVPTYSGVKYNEIPLKVNLKPYAPVPGDQGKSGSCVGWAVGYGALTMQYAILENLKDKAQITENALSASFIYNQIRLNPSDCAYGALIEDALALVNSKGDCLHVSFANHYEDCQLFPKEAHFLEAQKYSIKHYASLFAANEPEGKKISKACKILATKTPILVGMYLTDSFWEVSSGNQLWNPGDDEEISGAHAMVVVGYDNVKKQFELMNSFGAAWGNNGFVYIPFNDFERLCNYAYIMILGNEEKQIEDLEVDSETLKNNSDKLFGEFVLRQPAGYLTNAEGTEIPFFEEVSTTYSGKKYMYEPIKQSFEIGDAFQLVARKIPAGENVYVFSRNPIGKIQLHFPLQIMGGRTASFIISEEAEIVIPEESTVLQLSKKGDDYLCILYSSLPITDITPRLKSLEINTQPFELAFYEVFKDVLIDEEFIHYDDTRMRFNAITKSDDWQVAVPIILKINAN